MRRFASESAFITTPGSVLDLTVDQLHLHVGAPWVALYEYSPEGYTRVRQRGGQDLPQIVAADDLALVKLRAHGSEVDLHEAPTGLGRDGYAFPLRARDHLPGVLVVGPRPGGHYAADERERMAYVAHAVVASLFALRAQVTEEQLTVARAQAAASEALLNDARLRESRLLDALRARRRGRRLRPGCPVCGSAAACLTTSTPRTSQGPPGRSCGCRWARILRAHGILRPLREQHLTGCIGWLRAAVLGATDGLVSAGSMVPRTTDRVARVMAGLAQSTEYLRAGS